MRMIDVLNKDEKVAQRRTKKAVAELGGVMVDLDAARLEVKVLQQSKVATERIVTALREARRDMENEIANLTQETDGIRRSQKRDPDVAAALESGECAEDIYARMKPDVYGVAVYHVKNAKCDRWFLKMRWGNRASVIAESNSQDKILTFATGIVKLTGGKLRTIQVRDKQAIFDTKDC